MLGYVILKKASCYRNLEIHIIVFFQVNETFVSGLPRQTVTDLLRKAQGTVQLTVCRSVALHWAYSGNHSNTKAEPGKQLHPLHMT